MSNLSYARFEIRLEFGRLSSGKTMNAVLLHDNHECSGFAVDIKLPTKLKLVVSGKDMISDTISDDNGKVVEDLYVKIVKVLLDGIDLGEIFLHQKIKLVTNDGTWVSSYLGFNGHVDFVIDQPTVFQQIMQWRSVA
jgi:hypothetical protein